MAAQFSKQYDLDCITRDGDAVGRKGGFEGGFHDDRSSRIGAVLRIRVATQKMGELTAHSEVLTKKQEDTETAVNEVLREIRRLETEKEHLRKLAAAESEKNLFRLIQL